MNGIVLVMTLFFGIMIGVLFSTPIMNTMASTFIYANGGHQFEQEDGTIESKW